LFVRCIKSNPQHVPNVVNRKLVMEQLINGGVIAVLEIRHKGLPDRMEFAPFMTEFAGLADKKNQKKDFKTQSQLLLQSVFGKAAETEGEFACGHTKVFMKSHVASFLRGAAALRVRNIVRKVQDRWRKFMGTEKIRKVRHAWETYEHALSIAKRDGLEKLPMVADALFDGQTQIHPMVLELDKLEKELGKQNAPQVAKRLDTKKVRDLYKITKRVEGVVAFATKGRAQAEQLLANRVAQAIGTCTDHLEKVNACWADCEELGDRVQAVDKQTMKTAINAALDRLTKLQKTELPAIKRAGITIEVIEKWNGTIPETEADISPEVNEKMAAAQKLFDEVLRLDHEIAQVRVRFKMEVEHITPMYEESVVMLQGLQSDTARFVAEGMKEVADVVAQSWVLQAVALETFEAAKDPEKYMADVRAFAQAVKNTQDLFAEKEAELQRREAEKQERKELQESLDTLVLKVDNCKADVAKNLQGVGVVDANAEHFQSQLDSLKQEISGLGYSTETIEVWREQVAKIHEDVKAKIADIQKAMAQVKKDRNKQFDSKFSKFSGVSAGTSICEEESPEEIIQRLNMTSAEEELMEMHEKMVALEDAGLSRAQLQRVLGHFVKMTFNPKQAAEPAPLSPSASAAGKVSRSSFASRGPTSPASPTFKSPRGGSTRSGISIAKSGAKPRSAPRV